MKSFFFEMQVTEQPQLRDVEVRGFIVFNLIGVVSLLLSPFIGGIIMMLPCAVISGLSFGIAKSRREVSILLRIRDSIQIAFNQEQMRFNAVQFIFQMEGVEGTEAEDVIQDWSDILSHARIPVRKTKEKLRSRVSFWEFRKSVLRKHADDIAHEVWTEEMEGRLGLKLRSLEEKALSLVKRV